MAREPNGSHECCMHAVLLCYACCALVLCCAVLCCAVLCCADVLCMLCCCATHAVLLRCACCAAALCMLCITGMQRGLPPIARHSPGRWLHQWAEGTGHTAAQTIPDACCDPNAVMLGSSTAHNCCLLPACQDKHVPLAQMCAEACKCA